MTAFISEVLIPPKNSFAPYYNKTVEVSGIISDDIEFKKDDYRLNLKTDRGPVYIMVKTLPKDASIERSDCITFRGKMQSGFGNYAAFMYRPEIISIAHPNTPDFTLRVRDGVSASVRAQMDDSQSALALSFLTGQKTLLSEEQRRQLRLAGLAHIVVASGYHLSLVVSFARKIFGKISRFATFGSALIFLLFYIGVTGFSPSMIRAGIITFLSLWAWYFGRKFHPCRLILYTMAISLIMDSSFITNLAWQLSFASYAGIIFLTPLITKFLYGKQKPGYFPSLIIVSISAQLFCLPLTIYYFGIFPILALVSNILITPTIPLVMFGTILLAITRLNPVVFVVQKIISFQQFIVGNVASQSWASFDFGAGQGAVFLIYLPILAVIILLKWRTKHSFRPSCELAESPDYGKIYLC